MKVLIIDDDKFTQTVYKTEFNQENITAVSAMNGEEGLAKAKEEKPDLILLDIILPGKDGFEILEDLKQDSELKKIPVVVFSSLSQQADIDRAMKFGIAKFLPKASHSPKQIIDEIKNIVSAKA